MAIDSETKRRSALGMIIMALVIAPVPDGTRFVGLGLFSTEPPTGAFPTRRPHVRGHRQPGQAGEP